MHVYNIRNKTKQTNVIYFDPHKLQMTDHICYLNLGLKLTTLYSRYFNIASHLASNLDALKEHESKIDLITLLWEPSILSLRL